MKTELPAMNGGIDRRRFLFGTGLTVAGMALTLRSFAESSRHAGRRA